VRSLRAPTLAAAAAALTAFAALTAVARPSPLGPEATAAPTLAASTSTVGSGAQVALSGTAGSAAAGRTVYVEAKECGNSFFRVVTAARTAPGGSWTAAAPVATTTTFRARVGRAYSNGVVVRKRAVVSLAKRQHSRVFVASVHSGWVFEGKPIRLERYTTSGWKLVGQKKLEQNAVWGETYAMFRITRTGLRLRAVVPPSSARPCFLPAVSSIIRS
jgi:hypothetical protein